MEQNKEHLTNENLLKKFRSQFELVNYAIKLAENMIRTGREPRIKSENKNPALHVVVEIEEGMDRFDEIPQIVQKVVVQEVRFNHDDDEIDNRKSPEKKKLREARTRI